MFVCICIDVYVFVSMYFVHLCRCTVRVVVREFVCVSMYRVCMYVLFIDVCISMYCVYVCCVCVCLFWLCKFFTVVLQKRTLYATLQCNNKKSRRNVPPPPPPHTHTHTSRPFRI